jgi:hypothetical protein
MYRHLLPAIVAFTMTLVMPQMVNAGDAASEATVVIYRADESNKTKNLKFDLLAGEQTLGRMKAEQSVVVKAPAGSYTLDTNISATQPVTLDLKPGSVHYVHSKLKLSGSSLKVSLEEVPEQVARSQGAESLAGTI